MMAEWIKTATAQEVFDRVVAGFKAQHFEPCYEKRPEGGKFLTFGYNEAGEPRTGLVGFLVSADEWEAYGSLHDPWMRLAEVYRLVPKDHFKLIEMLDQVVTFGGLMRDMPARFRRVATYFNLNTTVLD